LFAVTLQHCKPPSKYGEPQDLFVSLTILWPPAVSTIILSLTWKMPPLILAKLLERSKIVAWKVAPFLCELVAGCELVAFLCELVAWCELVALLCELVALWCELVALLCELVALWCELVALLCELVALWCELDWIMGFVIVIWPSKPPEQCPGTAHSKKKSSSSRKCDGSGGTSTTRGCSYITTLKTTC